MNPKKKKLLFAMIALLAVVILTVALVLIFSSNHQNDTPKEDERDPLPSEVKSFMIDSAYLKLEFPSEYAQFLSHEELRDGGKTTQRFAMKYEGEEKELFCICFGDEKAGSLVGYLDTEDGLLAVTVSVAENASEDFSEAEEIYYAMLDGLNTVMEGIRADERFSEYKNASDEDAQVQLQYWQVELPRDVQYEETLSGGVYTAVFYAQIDGKRYELYTLSVGDPEAESLLGTYLVDGQAKPVCVKAGDTQQLDTISEEGQTKVFDLMDSINAVIEVITSSENFKTHSQE